MSAEFPRIAVFGATGAVGREALAILAERGHPADRVLAFGSPTSSVRELPFGDVTLEVRKPDLDGLPALDGCLLATDAAAAVELAPALVARGIATVDNSSAFRMDPGTPLVIPEVNGKELEREPRPRLVANPNCSTVLLLAVLEPIRRRFGIEEVIVSTYQAVSGAGFAAMGELEQQTRAYLEGSESAPAVFPEPCAFNVFPHESPVDPESGLNGEESKVVAETRRIWGEPAARVLPTCVRVPVFRAHSQSVLATLSREASESEVRGLLAGAPGLALLDERASGDFPTPRKAAGRDNLLVGRIRIMNRDGEPAPSGTRLALWSSGDQLRKGAALNALQILDRLLGRG